MTKSQKTEFPLCLPLAGSHRGYPHSKGRKCGPTSTSMNRRCLKGEGRKEGEWGEMYNSIKTIKYKNIIKKRDLYPEGLPRRYSGM